MKKNTVVALAALSTVSAALVWRDQLTEAFAQ